MIRGLPLLALLLSTGSNAAPQDAPPPVPDTTDIALLPVEERLTVPVEIADAGPYRFVIDTGAERTVISRQLATTLRLPAGRDVTVIAMTGPERVGTVTIPSLRLSSVPSIGAISAPALDMRNLGGHGLLGIDTLRDHKVTIDLDANTMAVSPSVRRSTGAPRSSDEIVVRARSMSGQLIVTDAELDGRQVRIVLDTGTSVSIGNAALRRLMGRGRSAFRPVTMTSVTGGTIVADHTSAGRLRLGGVTLENLPVAFAEVAPFERFGLRKRPALLLGMDALRLFRRVDIDFPNREVRFRLPRGVMRTPACSMSVGSMCSG